MPAVRILRLRRAVAAVLALVTAIALGACASPSAPTPTISAGAAHPNFVFVLADDLSMNLVEHMPELVRMQGEGRTMSRHYVVDSLCCPSRSSIMTGRYPHSTGVFTNAGTDGGISAFRGFGNQQDVYAVALQRAGYRTAFMGKYLNGYDPRTMGPEPGWDEWVVSGSGAYDGFGYTMNENGATRHYGRQPSEYMTDVLSGKADAFVRDAAAAGRPFVLEVAPYAPHAPFTPAPRHVGTMAGIPYPTTPAYGAAVRDSPTWLRGHRPLQPEEEAAFRRDWQLRLEADLAVDELIGSLRRTLADAGVAGETYVVFSSDNGLHMGEYRLTQGKSTAFETDVQVPQIVVGPTVPPGTTSDALVSSIDLAPTLLDLAGVGADPEADGISLRAIWHGRDPDDWQQGVLIEHHHRQGVATDPDLQNKRGADPPSYAAVRTADALYVRYADGEQEYYDTVRDPFQLDNRAREGVPARLERMLTALEACSGVFACQAAARTP